MSRRRHNDLDDDSDDANDTERDEETPKPHRTLSRKRLSDVFDASLASDRASRSVNINDDAAEKRRRRKSARVVIDDNEAGPSGDSTRDEPEPSRIVAGRRKQIPSVEENPAPQVSLDVMTSNFEQWMKMATDNKINANNSWDLALIDYFHDMSLLRNNTDNSINFQRASFTLDGCVKIWTSRVDSVGTETGKLLSNLANEGRVGDDDDNAEDNPNGEGTGQNARKRKAHRPGSTIAKDISQLRSKKLDVGFRVDPLFRKTCADFDEGGAQGLLMNHLGLGVFPDGSLRVVFDAGDSVDRDAEEDNEDEPVEEVNLAEIRKNYLPDLDALEDKAICPSLDDFAFAKDPFSVDNLTMFQEEPGALSDDDEAPDFQNIHNDASMDVDGAPPPPQEEDFFTGDQAVNEDYMYDENPLSPSVGSEHAEQGMGIGGGGGGAPVPFDPRRVPNERDLVLAPTADDGEIMFDYFDSAVTKNWAGPEHWKLRRVVRKPADTTVAGGDAQQPPKRRERKEAFKIDFLTPSDKSVKDIAKELFAPVTKGAGITLPKRKRKDHDDRRYDNTLPDDMHFSSRQLVTLFLKPKFSLKMRGQVDERAEGEIDENYWAQAAAEQAAHRADADGDIDQTQGGGAIPFNTQFFQDDDAFDGPAFEDDVAGPGGEDGDLLSTPGRTRRVRPEFVNYAKRAKRVDVRKLKENIWKGLDIVVREVPEGEEAMDVTDDDRPATDPSEPRVFDSVLSGLRQAYPRDKMDEISTSFCFICLLHLANERGLKLETGTETGIDKDGVNEEAEEAEREDERRIGNIWGLKVYRDPEATPAA